MRSYILLFVNGQQHRVDGLDAFLTLSEFLRDSLGMVGTKIVCSEGDCGSCSVLCGRVAVCEPNQDAEFKYVPIDSCIRFVFQLDGCHIVTVEGLAFEGHLNGVQQAMIDCHGSQCGFCTPGFVVAMTGILEENDQPAEQDWRRGLTGNLCRCTGYAPIIEAGLRSTPGNTPAMNERFPPSEMLKSIQEVGNDAILIKSPHRLDNDITQTLFAPTTLAQATDFLAEDPTSKIVAGGSDIGVQFNKGICQCPVWLDLNRVKELEGVRVEGNSIVAGARATWTELENLTKEILPQLYEIISIFGSPQIRNVGTIGGNIINASPIADSLPFLFVCNAQLEISGAAGTRTVNINDFYQGYKKFDLRMGELLSRIVIPLPDSDDLRLYKVSRRRDLDISSFTAAICIQRDGDMIKEAAIAYGAVGPVVLRLPQTEKFLVGRTVNLETMRLAGDIAVSEITPITDVRGGADFRIQLARNVLLKFYHETCSTGAIA